MVTVTAALVVAMPQLSVARAVSVCVPAADGVQLTEYGALASALPMAVAPSKNTTLAMLPSLSDAVAVRVIGVPTVPLLLLAGADEGHRGRVAGRSGVDECGRVGGVGRWRTDRARGAAAARIPSAELVVAAVQRLVWRAEVALDPDDASEAVRRGHGLAIEREAQSGGLRGERHLRLLRQHVACDLGGQRRRCRWRAGETDRRCCPKSRRAQARSRCRWRRWWVARTGACGCRGADRPTTSVGRARAHRLRHRCALPAKLSVSPARNVAPAAGDAMAAVGAVLSRTAAPESSLPPQAATVAHRANNCTRRERRVVGGIMVVS